MNQIKQSEEKTKDKTGIAKFLGYGILTVLERASFN